LLLITVCLVEWVRTLGVLIRVSLDLVDWKAFVMLAWEWGRSHTLSYLFVDSLAKGPEIDPLPYMVVIFCTCPRHLAKLGHDLSALFHIHFSHIVLSSNALWSYLLSARLSVSEISVPEVFLSRERFILPLQVRQALCCLSFRQFVYRRCRSSPARSRLPSGDSRMVGMQGQRNRIAA